MEMGGDIAMGEGGWGVEVRIMCRGRSVARVVIVRFLDRYLSAL